MEEAVDPKKAEDFNHLKVPTFRVDNGENLNYVRPNGENAISTMKTQ
jgi:hypothetical protein